MRAPKRLPGFVQQFEFDLIEFEHVDLATGAIEIAREGAEFEKEESPAVVRRLVFDFLNLGLDGLGKLAGFV